MKFWAQYLEQSVSVFRMHLARTSSPVFNPGLYMNLTILNGLWPVKLSSQPHHKRLSHHIRGISSCVTV